MGDLFRKYPLGCMIMIGFLAGVAIVLVCSSFYRRLDPGEAGIVINYALASREGKPVVTVLQTGQYVYIGPFSGKDLVEYPVAQQQLVLSSNTQEGEIPGDSTVPCLMSGGGTISFGLSVYWNVARPDILYFKKPGMALTSSFNNDVNTTLVLNIVKGDLLDLCTHYTWEQILQSSSSGQNESDQIKAKLLTNLQTDLGQDGIAVSQIAFNERNPDSTIQAVLNAQNDAQRSAYLKQQAEYQAEAQVAQAQGQAQAIAIINKQLAQSSAYLQYEQIQKWDGHLPSTLVTNGSNPIVSPLK